MSQPYSRLGTRGVIVEDGAAGETLLRHPEALDAYPNRFTERLEKWAREAPDRVFLAERDGEGWRTIGFREALAKIEAIGQALLDRGLTSATPVMTLSINTIDHALVALACLHVGIPSAPVSLGYATLSTDYERLAHAVEKIRPALVFTHDADLFAEALGSTLPQDVEIVASAGSMRGHKVTPIAELAAVTPGPQMAAARDAVTGDTVARLIFTSGSSSLPKAVINTHRMLAANQQMHAQVWRFMEDTPPVLADWAPWNHTAGANVALGVAVYFGGSLYIDDGRATPAEIQRTAHNLAEVRPTVFFGVPVVYQLLTPLLKADRRLRDGFFARLQMLFYAGGTIADSVWNDLRAMMVETRGGHVYTTGGYGATEMSPSLFLCSWDAGRPGIVGLPVPGVAVKLTPVGDKLEVRVKGPSVTPGYWRNEEATAKAFDADGWYCTGDAARFDDPARPLDGLVYDGRLSENFKLATGTWVSVAPLRAQAVRYFQPLVGDVVLVGHGEAEIGLVLFPILTACRRLPGCEDAAGLADLLARPAFRREMQARLEELAQKGNSSTTRITRAVLIPEEPSGIEITDKKTLSFNAVMRRREADIAGLYAGQGGERFLYSSFARLPKKAVA
jgi:feruloyl-CoA synthase